jgi:hypothetical protein
MVKIDTAGRHSGGGGARAVWSGDRSRCPGTEDIRVSGEHEEERRKRRGHFTGDAELARPIMAQRQGTSRRRRVCEGGRCRDAQARGRGVQGLVLVLYRPREGERGDSQGGDCQRWPRRPALMAFTGEGLDEGN